MCVLLPIHEIAKLKFSVAALADLFDEPGSYRGEVARMAAAGIEARLDWVYRQLKAANEGEVIPLEVLDLVRFMCATWFEMDTFVYQKCDYEALDHYPVVQGTSNQIRLQRIEEQPYNEDNVRKAAEWMQRYNSVFSGASREDKT